MSTRNRFLSYGKHLFDNIVTFFKWMAISITVGIVVGLVGVSFYKVLAFVGSLRENTPWLLYFLPIGGVVIAFLYRYWMKQKDKGTNLVLAAIASGEEITPKLAPLIYVATVITHLFGGSAGREGAAFQIGGCIGNLIGRFVKLDETDKHTIIMCGMSAGFSALFGTPMAAAFFAMEIISVGVMYYGALVPCVVSSFVSVTVAGHFHVEKVRFLVPGVPGYTPKPVAQILLLAVLCALISGVFCYLLHKTGRIYREHLKNPFVRVVVGALLVILVTLLLGTRDYNGDGMRIIRSCFTGEKVALFAFFWKMVLTALTLGAGFKGGEIVPSLFVGATFGHTFGVLLHFSPGFCAAVGMIGVFCGVTNCPVTSLLLAFEMFGYRGASYMILAVAISYMLSGYYGLYDSQKIMYSKMKTSYVNRRVNNHAKNEEMKKNQEGSVR